MLSAAEGAGGMLVGCWWDAGGGSPREINAHLARSAISRHRWGRASEMFQYRPRIRLFEDNER
jgi:hypothetical protein